MKSFTITLQTIHMALSAHAVALESEFGSKGGLNLMRGVASIANRGSSITSLDQLTMNTFVINIFHKHVTLAARFGNTVLANAGVRMRMGENVMHAVAVVASGSYYQAIHQQRSSVNRVYEMGHRLLLMYVISFQNRFFLMAGAACLMEVELTGSGARVGGWKYVVAAMTVFASGDLRISPLMPDAVNALLIILIHIIMAHGAEQLKGRPFIVGTCLKGLGASVTVGAG